MFAHLLNEHFHIHADARDFQRGGFAAEGVGFAVQFLNKEIQPPPDFAALGKHGGNFIQVRGEAIQLFGHVNADGVAGRFGKCALLCGIGCNAAAAASGGSQRLGPARQKALLLRLAKDARNLGVELLVLDDGWFGDRDEDNRALGDWTPNRRKLPDGLGGLIRKVKAEGLKFGLWIEPEMVSENSDLFRAHPDWALRVPGRQPAIGRNQMVLDLSRPEIADWLYETVAGLLRENSIDYIKWDMNRAMTDLFSARLPAERQGELAHRYILGLYSVLGRLTEEFPEVLFEGCAGGGGRFDAGMLAFHPQIWCSDNTDPIARLCIQEGSSYGYPASAVGAHVSASPNHQTGRSTPFGTRAAVAMAGTFGYELDPAKLSEEERQEVRRQIAFFHRIEDLVREGDYYRLTAMEKERFTAWQFVSEDKEKSLFTLVLTEPEGNPHPVHVRMKGLKPEKR